MRILLAAAGVAAVLAGTVASAETVYQPYHLLGTGYRDHVDPDGTWKTWGFSHDLEGGRMLALYRAAELADDQGIAALRIVDQGITVEERRGPGGRPDRIVSEIAHFSMRPVRTATDLTVCAMRHTDRCLTLSTAKVLAAYGPLLHQRDVPKTPGLLVAGAAYGAPANPWQVQLMAALARRAGSIVTPAVAPLPAAPESAATADAALDPYEAGRRAGLAALAASGVPRR